MISYSIPPTVGESLRAAFARTCSPYQDAQRALVGLHRAFGALPDDLLDALLRFGRDPTSPGCLLIDGLPVDTDLPDTPSQGEVPRDRGTLDAEKSLLGLAQLVGTPVGYLTEKDGDLVHHVVPMRGGETTQSNRGSRVFLTYHNDSMYDESLVFNSHNPDHLLLLCVRADHQRQARTLYAAARDICTALDPEVRAVLRERRFRMAAPSNYTLLIRGAGADEKVWSHPVAVLSGPQSTPEIYIAANGVTGIDASAEHALSALREACETVGERSAVRLQPGQALLINNRKGVHARTYFEPAYDGRDRWLMRANVRTSLWNIRDRATAQALVFA